MNESMLLCLGRQLGDWEVIHPCLQKHWVKLLQKAPFVVLPMFFRTSELLVGSKEKQHGQTSL